jgi:hypothetical protein
MNNLSVYMRVPVILLVSLSLMFALPGMACTESASPDVNQSGIMPVPDGQVLHIGTSTVLYGISQVMRWVEEFGVVNGPYGVLVKDGKYLIYFALNGGTAFFGIDGNGSYWDVARQFLKGGNYANFKDFQSLAKALRDQGWVSVGYVPMIIKESAKEFVRLYQNVKGVIPVGGRWTLSPALIILPATTIESIECFPSCNQEQ